MHTFNFVKNADEFAVKRALAQVSESRLRQLHKWLAAELLDRQLTGWQILDLAALNRLQPVVEVEAVEVEPMVEGELDIDPELLEMLK